VVNIHTGIHTLPFVNEKCSKGFRKDLSEEHGLSTWKRSQCKDISGSNTLFEFLMLLILPGQNPNG